MSLTHVYGGDIVKFNLNDDGTLDFLSSKATGPDLDIDQQICDPGWLAKAMPKWFETGANVREMHSSIAAGVASELETTADGSHFISGKVVDPGSVAKIKAGVLKGLSVGIKGPKVIKDAAAPGGRIVGGTIVEVSLVDRPANPDCRLVLAKVAGSSVAQVEELTEKRDVSSGERKQDASEGKALPDGSFPIATVGDLRNAIRAIGRAKNRAKAMAHIKRRARALGRSDLIPAGWKGVLADLEKLSPEVGMAQDAIRSVAQVILAEAGQMADGEDEAGDLRMLLDAVSALQCFIYCESNESEEDDMPLTMAALADLVKSASEDERAELSAALALPTAPPSNPDVTKVSSTAASTTAPAGATVSTTNGTDDPSAVLLAKFGTMETTFASAMADLKASLTDANKGIEDRLATVERMAAPGGPVRTRTTEQVAKSAEVDRVAEIERYRRLAAEVQDPSLAAAYSAKAAQLSDR